jgi:DNA-binding Lrp family transcriptional regulator
MTTKAYILIETEIGKSREVIPSIEKLEGVKSIDLVTGPYDLIAVVELEDLDAVGDLVTARIHATPGVTRTVTCLAIRPF